jgi:hypothetical protein
MNCPWYLTDPWVPHAIDALAAVFWTAFLGYSLGKQRFSFGRRYRSGWQLAVERGTRPKAYRYLVIIVAVLIVVLVVEAIAWPWPLGAAWYANSGCGGWTGSLEAVM